MYRLTLIAAPSEQSSERGKVFSVSEGQVAIGRAPENQIVLESKNVSKKHCLLLIRGEEVLLKDQGSSNGTFVNGKLAAQKRLQIGDKLSVGEFVFQVGKEKPKLRVIDGSAPAVHSAVYVPVPDFIERAKKEVQISNESKSIVSKLKVAFEKNAIGYFISLNEKVEWKTLAFGLLLILLFAHVFVSNDELISQQRVATSAEVGRRALGLARELADRNQAALLARNESATQIGRIKSAEGIRQALIVDLNKKVLVPRSDIGSSFTVQPETDVLQAILQATGNSLASGIFVPAKGNIAVALEPILSFDPALGKNVTVAVAIVSIDANLFLPSASAVNLAFSFSMIISLIFLAFISWIIFKVMTNIFDTLTAQIDESVKVGGREIQFKYQFSEMKPLLSMIDLLLKRSESTANSLGGDAVLNAVNDLEPLKAALTIWPHAVLLVDAAQTVLGLNVAFEELTGDREGGIIGQVYATVSRDGSFAAMVEDLVTQSGTQNGSVQAESEFSGTTYLVSCVTLRNGAQVSAYLIQLFKKDGGA